MHRTGKGHLFARLIVVTSTQGKVSNRMVRLQARYLQRRREFLLKFDKRKFVDGNSCMLYDVSKGAMEFLTYLPSPAPTSTI